MYKRDSCHMMSLWLPCGSFLHSLSDLTKKVMQYRTNAVYSVSDKFDGWTRVSNQTCTSHNQSLGSCAFNFQGTLLYETEVPLLGGMLISSTSATRVTTDGSHVMCCEPSLIVCIRLYRLSTQHQSKYPHYDVTGYTYPGHCNVDSNSKPWELWCGVAGLYLSKLDSTLYNHVPRPIMDETWSRLDNNNNKYNNTEMSYSSKSEFPAVPSCSSSISTSIMSADPGTTSCLCAVPWAANRIGVVSSHAPDHFTVQDKQICHSMLVCSSVYALRPFRSCGHKPSRSGTCSNHQAVFHQQNSSMWWISSSTNITFSS